MKFEKSPPSIDFPALEREVLARWKEGRIFERSVEEKDPENLWSFYDGPPFATGLPHYGHLLAGTIKDVIPRYWAMRGKYIERRFGWDCHGLPVEFEIQKDLNLHSRKDIQEYGIDRFNESCRSIVLRYTTEWRQTVERMGRWIDFDHDYKTMNLDFMESVWAVFKRLWDQGLVYEDRKVLPYSSKITAPLSNFEANLNYMDVQDPSITIKLALVDRPGHFLLAWTTTPWTLPANLAVAAHPDSRTRRSSTVNRRSTITCSRSAWQRSTRDGSQRRQEGRRRGERAVHRRPADVGTRPRGSALSPTHPGLRGTDPGGGPPGAARRLRDLGHRNRSRPHRTGLRRGRLPPRQIRGNRSARPPRRRRRSHERGAALPGPLVQGLGQGSAALLKEQHLLFKQETLLHSYPFCYRSDTPLMYRAIPTWFVKVTALKEELIANNQQIRWVPDHLKDGRFGKWLENARDWPISRNRYWGISIPIWRDEETERCCASAAAPSWRSLPARR
ncbi:MAG: class I tRNA ligase family protein [Candidatus Eisenbacteria bacterium]